MGDTSIAVKDDQKISSDLKPVIELIHDVRVREIKNVLSDHSYVTEYYRAEWDMFDEPPEHVVHVNLTPGTITAWHMHKKKWDYIVVPTGMIKLVLFDPRDDSPTKGKVNVFNMSPLTPSIVGFPPGVWHGFQNLLDSEMSSFINLSSTAYTYEDPDEWRIPVDSPEIPFTF